MKISLLVALIALLSICTLGLSSCNKGYGCSATESLKKSGPNDYNTGIFGNKKPKSGNLFKNRD